MAVDFSKYSNIDNIEESPFSSVIFGANAPVLEVELNEMQQIINSKISRLCKALAPIIIPLTDYETIHLSTTTDAEGHNWLNVSLFNDTICFTKDGLSFNIGSGSSLNILSTELNSEGKITLYANAKEVNVDSKTKIPWYGDEQGIPMDNTIIDSRAGIETSRRKMVTYSIKASNDSSELSKASIILGTISWEDTSALPTFEESEFWGNVPSKFTGIENQLNNKIDECIKKEDVIQGGKTSSPLVSSIPSYEISGTFLVQRYKITDNVYLLDLCAEITDIDSLIAGDGVEVTLTLQDFGFDFDKVASGVYGCSLFSYNPLLFNISSSSMDAIGFCGGSCKTEDSSNMFYINILQHSNTHTDISNGYISPQNKSILRGSMLLQIK